MLVEAKRHYCDVCDLEWFSYDTFNRYFPCPYEYRHEFIKQERERAKVRRNLARVKKRDKREKIWCRGRQDLNFPQHRDKKQQAPKDFSPILIRARNNL